MVTPGEATLYTLACFSAVYLMYKAYTVVTQVKVRSPNQKKIKSNQCGQQTCAQVECRFDDPQQCGYFSFEEEKTCTDYCGYCAYTDKLIHLEGGKEVVREKLYYCSLGDDILMYALFTLSITFAIVLTVQRKRKEKQLKTKITVMTEICHNSDMLGGDI